MSNRIKTLAELYASHTGKISDRWKRYLSEYELLFKKLRNEPVRLLEIGVQNGGGLEIWAKYFRLGTVLIGCDINPACAALHFEDPRIKLVIGDANSDLTQNEILSHSPELDIVIEDGSHLSGDSIRSFLRYFPNLTDGGIYVVEDLHTSYWDEFDGGLFAPLSSISFFKRLVDIINSEHWGVERDRLAILAGFREKYGVEIKAGTFEYIHSIEFANSLCIIHKSQPAENRLGTRIVAGRIAEVSDDMEVFRNSVLIPPAQRSNPWSTRVRPPDEELPEREQEVQELSLQVSDYQKEVQELNLQVIENQEEIQSLQQSNQSLTGTNGVLKNKLDEAGQTVQSLSIELSEIHRSRAWHLVQLLWRFRVWLIPHGSARERMAVNMYRPIRYWRRHGLKGLIKRIFRRGPASQITGNTAPYPATTPQAVIIPEGVPPKADKREGRQQLLVRSLPVFLSPFSRQRLNVLIREINSDQPFGPLATALILSALLAEKWDCELRIVTNQDPVDKQFLGHILRANNIPLDRNIEFVTINADVSKAELPIGSGDVFLTTSWYITAGLLHGVDEDKIIYLLQADEITDPLTKNGNDQQLDVLRNRRIKFVVNTKALFDRFASAGFDNIQANGIWFEPARPGTLFFPDGQRPDGRKNFLFAGSPDSEDLNNLGLEVLEKVLQKGLIDVNQWNFFSIGGGSYKARTSPLFFIKRYQDLTWKEYVSLARKTDLALVLTGAPSLFPGYHPFDLASCGAVVVTDFLGEEQGKAISRNIISSGAQAGQLVQSLTTGAALAQNTDLRLQNFHSNTISMNWRISLQDCLSAIRK